MEVRSVEPMTEPMLTVAFRVRRNRRETADTRTLELTSIAESAVPAWHPGQFMMVYVFGKGEIPISISGDPAIRDCIVHTVRTVGPVSQAISDAKEGSTVGLRGPFGSIWPIERTEGKEVILIAGGIGLAPLRPVLHAIMANRDRYTRVSLLAGARTPDIFLYKREMDTWMKRGVDVRLTVDAAAPGWKGSVGPVTTLIPRVEFDPSRVVAFIVGPEIMMRVVAQALAGRGVSYNRVFISMERNMKCAVGFCGHCQLGPAFICKDGPIFPYSTLEPWLAIRNA
jgi:NAD(P)H-flavin reductase